MAAEASSCRCRCLSSPVGGTCRSPLWSSEPGCSVNEGRDQGGALDLRRGRANRTETSEKQPMSCGQVVNIRSGASGTSAIVPPLKWRARSGRSTRVGLGQGRASRPACARTSRRPSTWKSRASNLRAAEVRWLINYYCRGNKFLRFVQKWNDYVINLCHSNKSLKYSEIRPQSLRIWERLLQILEIEFMI